MRENQTYRDERRDESERVAYAFEIAVLAVIAARLGAISDTSSYVDMAANMTLDMGRIQSILDKLNKILQKRTAQMYSDLGRKIDAWAKPYYDARNMRQPSASDDFELASILNSGASSSSADLDRLCKTSVLRIIGEGGSDILSNAYRDRIDQAIREIASGYVSREDAVRKAVMDLARSGLRVEYESGLTRELYAAVSMNIDDGYFDTMQRLERKSGEKFGADGVEIDAHGMCAPDHIAYQGRQFSNEDYEKINEDLASQGMRPFEHGMNCKHMVDPIIMGVDEPLDKDYVEGLKKSSERETRYKDRNGKEHKQTLYQFTQVQRRMETNIRKLKGQKYLMEKAGLKTDALSSEIRLATDEYYSVSKRVGVKPRSERLQVMSADV